MSFIPSTDGYLVAMNRDELLARGIAESPFIHSYGAMQVVHPLDVSRGTWIAVNGEGTTWALLNWNLGAKSIKERSRGEVVLEVATLSRPSDANSRISAVSIKGTDPFRLIGISSLHREVVEWRWNASELHQIVHAWQRNHWFSSGKGDALAAEHRQGVFGAHSVDPDSGSMGWLHRMHASHEPQRGAFSVCVHRSDAATVSYTEVHVSREQVKMLYRAGSPCELSHPLEVGISLRVKSQFAL